MATGNDKVRPEDAERLANMLMIGAAALTYVTDDARWAGFVAWIEQAVPSLPGKFGGDEIRAMVRQDARMLLAMGKEAEGGMRE